MIKEIRDELFRIGEKVHRKQLFELCPIYFFAHNEESNRHIQYLLNDLRHDLADRNLFASKSDTLLCFRLSYESADSQMKLFDEYGNYKNGLDVWLSYIGVKYHLDCGIILINIDEDEAVRDYLWWRQFFLDLHKHKKKFLFLVSCSSSLQTAIYSMFEKEFFTVMYQADDFTAKDYFDRLIVQIGEYSVTLDETTKTGLKNMLVKYENDISFHVLELWLNSSLWSYYGSKNSEKPLSLDCFSEELLRQLIKKIKKYNCFKIGFY